MQNIVKHQTIYQEMKQEIFTGNETKWNTINKLFSSKYFPVKISFPVNISCFVWSNDVLNLTRQLSLPPSQAVFRNRSRISANRVQAAAVLAAPWRTVGRGIRASLLAEKSEYDRKPTS